MDERRKSDAVTSNRISVFMGIMTMTRLSTSRQRCFEYTSREYCTSVSTSTWTMSASTDYEYVI